MNVFNTEPLFEKIYSYALKKLSADASCGKNYDLMLELYDKAEKYAEKHISEEEISHIYCRPSCPFCCRLNVPVLSPEVSVICGYLKNNLSKSKIRHLVEKIKKLHMNIKYLDDVERIYSNSPCAFLDENESCSIHPVRPFICRSVTSTDAEECKSALSMMAISQEQGVQMNIKQKKIMETGFKALAKAMDRNGLCSKSRELTDGVVTYLKNYPI